uniref:Uncharacterized protein n=1 Tax=Arion vulgaris TaxID=1028688 RepID=A0A0B7AGD4_9EUPU
MAKKNVEMGERRRTNVDSKRLSTASIPSLSAPEELQLDLRPAPNTNSVNTTTVVAVVEKLPEGTADVKPESSQEPKKGVKFAESTKKNRAPQIGELKKLEGEKAADKEKDEEIEKKEIKDEKETEIPQEAVTVPSVLEKEVSSIDEVDEAKKVGDVKDEPIKETEVSERSVDAVEEILPEKDEKVDEISQKANVEENAVQKDEFLSAKEEDVSNKETKLTKKLDQNFLLDQRTVPISEIKTDVKQEDTSSLTKEEVIEEVQQIDEKAIKVEDRPDPGKTDSSTTVVETQIKYTKVEVETRPKSTKVEVETQPNSTKVEVESQPKSTKVEYEYRKAPNPPFMSTALLQPMKAEIPKPKRAEEDIEALRENIRKSEELRVLEEELLGEKAAKVEKDLEDLPDNVDIDQMLEEEYALKLEEEELLAIGDELRQKIATERSEMERLNQEIQELQYLRQDSDLEDLSTSSSSSDESEDEDDLQDLVSQLIQENEELEMNNADLCQKIHEERMICLSVKLQIRLLQQKQLESSYG